MHINQVAKTPFIRKDLLDSQKDYYDFSQTDKVATITLKKPEIIYNDDFFSDIIAAALLGTRIVELNCGKNSNGAKFIANELTSEEWLEKLSLQDDIPIQAETIIKSIPSDKQNNEYVFVIIKKIQEEEEKKEKNNPDELKLVATISPGIDNNSKQLYFANNDPLFQTDPIYIDSSTNIPIDENALKKLSESTDPASIKDGTASISPLSKNVESNTLFASYPVGNSFISPIIVSDLDLSGKNYKEEIVLDEVQLVSGDLEDTVNKILDSLNKGKLVEIKLKNFLGEANEYQNPFDISKNCKTNEITIDTRGQNLSGCEEVVVPIIIEFLNRGITIEVDLGSDKDREPDDDETMNENIFNSMKYRVTRDFEIVEEQRDGYTKSKHNFIVFKVD